MTALPSRRTVVATATAGIAGLVGASLFAPLSAMAATSSAAGIVAGGSLAGTAKPVNFSAFGTRITFDDATDPTLLGALVWADEAGLDGAMVTFDLVSVTSYGPSSHGSTEDDTERTLAGTVSANGEGEHPFALVLTDGGSIGNGIDHARLMVGAGVAALVGTPVAGAGIDYDVEGDLATGNIQIVTLA